MKTKGFAAPYVVWMLLFTIAPILLVLCYAFTDASGQFTLQNFQSFLDPIYVGVLFRSIGMALLCTLILPAGGLSGRPTSCQPLLRQKGSADPSIHHPHVDGTSCCAPIGLADAAGVRGLIATLVNWVLRLFGAKEEVRLLYSYQAVLMGMVYNYLPFMVLPLYTVLSKMDARIVEAAEDLGANRLQVFLRVTLPLSLPGVFSGLTMVFMPP